MKISCTVKEFGQIVRGCEKCSCYNCPLIEICGGDKEKGIEQFISAADIVEDVLFEYLKERGVADG